MMWPKITPARVTFKDEGTPESSAFSDIYHFPGRGLEEKTHVFLEGISLDGLLTPGKPLVIGELGFGMGLNFLLSWQRARKLGRPLHYISIEGYPLAATDLKACYEGLGPLQNLSDQLVKSWPPMMPGFHRVSFDDGQITLTLVFGEVLDSLKQINGRADAWFLDGFSPDKNPDMWSRDVFNEVSRLSGDGARLATYSAAGKVRRGLEEVGFKAEKRSGYGGKRESLAGTFEGKRSKDGLPAGSRIAVIGGGIAGCAVTHALAARGYDVHLFEQGNRLAAGTSGHALAVVKPKLQRGYDAYSAFYLWAYLYTQPFYDGLEERFGGVWHQARGALQLTTSEKDRLALKGLAETFPELFSHVNVTQEGLYFAKGGCVDPESLCHLLTAKVHIHLGQTSDGKGFDAIVYANGRHAFDAFAESPFRLTRGQSNYLPGRKNAPPHTLSFPGGYLTPITKHGFHILGTSFQVCKDPDSSGWAQLLPQNFKSNLEALSNVAPGLAKEWADAPLEGRVALRTETADHLPVVGPGFDPATLEKVFREKQKLHHSQRTVTNEADLPGVYVFSGFASRGFTAAPYAAEILADQIAGIPRPCPAFIEAALDPKRFAIKELKSS